MTEFDHSNVGSDMIISGVTFGDGILEIQYMEKRDQADDAGLMKILVVKKTKFSSQVESVLDELYEIIDGGLLDIRNPEASFDPRRRLANQVDPAPVVEGEDEGEG